MSVYKAVLCCIIACLQSQLSGGSIFYNAFTIGGVPHNKSNVPAPRVTRTWLSLVYPSSNAKTDQTLAVLSGKINRGTSNDTQSFNVSTHDATSIDKPFLSFINPFALVTTKKKANNTPNINHIQANITELVGGANDTSNSTDLVLNATARVPDKLMVVTFVNGIYHSATEVAEIASYLRFAFRYSYCMCCLI